MKSREDNIGKFIFDLGIVKHFLNKTPKLLMIKGLIKWTTLKIITYFHLGFPCGSAGKESACNAGDLCSSWEDPLEKGMATHSNILTWRIPWTV